MRSDYATFFETLLDASQQPQQLTALLEESMMMPVTAELLIAGASALRSRTVLPAVEGLMRPLADNCGTGGSGNAKFNISTTAAIVAASCGTRVAKHGNRSASGRCGSADLLFALGCPDTVSLQDAVGHLSQSGFGFFFAPAAHPALKHLGPLRKALGQRTIFNLLGPLVNPMQPNTQLLGVAKRSYLVPMAKALHHRGVGRAAVVCASDGTDELTTDGLNYIVRVNGDVHPEIVLDGRSYSDGTAANPRTLTTIADFVDVFHEILEGTPGYFTDNVLLNAAYLMWLNDDASSLDSAHKTAKVALVSGRVRQFFESWLTLVRGQR